MYIWIPTQSSICRYLTSFLGFSQIPGGLVHRSEMATDVEKRTHDAAVEALPSPERGQRKVRWYRSTFYNAVILGVCECGDAFESLDPLTSETRQLLRPGDMGCDECARRRRGAESMVSRLSMLPQTRIESRSNGDQPGSSIQPTP